MKIRKLHIQRMPGFPQGLKGLDKLAGNVNIIAGPNGSGKSSTARVIQKLLWWSNKTTGYHVNAQIDVREEQNRIEIDSQSYIRTDSRKKTQEDFSYISPAEFSSQYMLALHDLVRDNDDNLASIIAREVNGGVDLKQAGDKLGYKNSLPTLNNPHYKEYESANRIYKELVTEQAGIIRDEESLAQLEEDKKLALEASKLKDLFERALHYLESKEKNDFIRARLEQLPVSLSRMREDDCRTVESLELSIQETERFLAKSQQVIDANKIKISGLRIPGEKEIPEEYLYELAERTDRLKGINLEIASCEREIASQQIAVIQAGKCINTEQELSALRGLNLEQIHKLDEIVRSANETAGNYNNLQNRKELLENELTGLNNKIQFSSSETELLNGISFLSAWLKEEAVNNQSNKPGYLWIIPAWGTVAVLMGYYGGLAGIITTVIISVGLIFFLLMMKKKINPATTVDSGAKNAYQKLRISQPSVWENEVITDKIDELLEQLKLNKQKASLEEKIGNLSQEIVKNRGKWYDIDERYTDYKKQMGVLPEHLEKLTADYNSFYFFLCNLIKWQEAITGLEKLKSGKQTHIEQYNHDLEEINRLLAGMNFDAAENFEQALSRLKSIKKEREVRKDALQEIENESRLIIIREQEKERNLLKLNEIYERIGINPGDKQQIQLLNNQYPTYRKFQEEQSTEEGNLNAKFELLERHSLYGDYKDVIQGMTTNEIAVKIKDYELRAERLNELSQREAEIKTRVKDKKSRKDIEIALGKKEEALTELNGFLKSTLKSVTGGMIFTHLHDEISLNNENRIFKEANRILGSITKGRYNLILSEGLLPAFLAHDNVLNCVQSLTEISTGTRVQLLLAIRLAYIESQENTVKLPLLADELLANSDDERSEAIIRSLIEISRNRQLFYFTAQADEVEKWKHYLKNNPDLDSEIIILGNKLIVYEKAAPEIHALNFSKEICEPTGFDHPGYGKKLGVPAFNLLEQSASEIHLWYLLEDINLLYICLQHGFYQWGQLCSFRENGGKLPGMDDNTWQNLKNKIILFNRFKELYILGRSRKINRDVLIASQAVSEAYLDKITELLTEKGNNPEELLEALDSGMIKGFRANKKEELRSYLLEHNYISTVQPYKEEDIRIRISALISSKGMDWKEAERFLNRFINFPSLSSLKENRSV